MANETLTQEQARNASLNGGYKIRHESFLPHEYIMQLNDNEIMDESGMIVNSVKFWYYRNSVNWQTGWSIIG